jgi:hypothetical protein
MGNSKNVDFKNCGLQKMGPGGQTGPFKELFEREKSVPNVRSDEAISTLYSPSFK